jgi:hypothetical protein
MLSKLRALENLQFHSSARILIICSTVPGVFCAGADLKVRLNIILLLSFVCAFNVSLCFVFLCLALRFRTRKLPYVHFLQIEPYADLC